MKKIDLTKNLSLKIIAVVFAAVLWLFVRNIDDPIDREVYNDIPISIINGEIITNDGKTYTIADDDVDAVRVVVRARTSALKKIRSKDITAVVDLRERDADTGVVPIKAVVSGYEDSLDVVTETSPNNVLVKVEDSTNKSFPIAVRYTGEPREGYEVGELKANPERIQIGGAESMVEDIQSVVARIDVAGKYQDCVLEAKLIYFDGNGNTMDQSALRNNLGEEGVSVEVQILPTKEVDLEFNVSGTPADGYRFTGLISEPEQIKICGTKEVLNEIDKIEIPASEIDISNLQSREEYTIDITPYLPEGARLAQDEASSVIVNVMVEEEGTRTILLPVGAIQINNLSNRLSAEIDTTGDLAVQFTGDEQLLEKLDILNAASIDLREYKEPGTYEVPVHIEIESNVALKENPMISVTLTKKEEEPEE